MHFSALGVYNFCGSPNHTLNQSKAVLLKVWRPNQYQHHITWEVVTNAECQPHPRPAGSETLGRWSPAIYVLTSSPGDSDVYTFKNHWAGNY